MITLLLGKTRARRARGLPRLGAAGLVVVDSPRARRVLERGATGLVPRVRLVGELLEELWLRHGDGRAIPSRRGLALAAEAVVREGGHDWFAGLGTPREAGRALAALATRLEEAGAPVTGTGHDAEIARALDALSRRLASRGLVRRGEAMRLLLEQLRAPSPSLRRWLARPGAVVLDELLATTPLRTALLVALARAWSAAGAEVVVTLASGRDLGGREAGFFFEYDEADGYPLKPFAAARSWRRALFELVASGEAGIAVATADAVLPVEPFVEAAPAEPPDLSDAVYGSHEAPPPPTLTVGRAADPDAELRAAASALKEVLLAGAAPEQCALAVAGLAGREGAVRAVLDDYGIPAALAAGRPLSASPIATAALRVATLALDGLPAGPLLQLLDQLELPLPIPATTLRRWCRAAGVRGGPPPSWRPLLAAWLARERRADAIPELEPALEAVAAHAEALLPLADDADPETWRGRLLDALRALRLPERVGHERAAVAAWGATLRAVDALSVDLLLASAEPWPARALAEHLGDAFAATPWQPERPGPGRVEVVDARDLCGPMPEHVWIVGLSRRAFGHGSGPDGLLPRELDRRLRPLDPLAEARYLLGAWLREACAGASVSLTWPEAVDERPAPPAAPLADLLAVLEPARVEPRPRLARSDALRLAAEAVAWLPAVEEPLRTHLGAQRRAWDARRAEVLGGYDAVLSQAPPAPGALAVTALETYLRCPARYWYTRVLRLRPADDWSPELEPRRRGTVIHRILERFLVERSLAPLHGSGRAAAADLHRVASEELDAVEAEGGFEPALQAWARSRWLAGLVDDRPAGLLAVWLRDEADGLPRIPVAAERGFSGLPLGPITLRGSIDRLDRLPGGGLLVTDYKTGAAPTARQVEGGLALQPVAYAEAVAAQHPGEPVAATYLELRRPDALRRAGWVGDPEVLDRATGPRERARALAVDAEGRRALLDRAAARAEELVAGRFPTTLAGPTDAGCPSCPVRRVCRVDHGRNRRIAEAACAS